MSPQLYNINEMTAKEMVDRLGLTVAVAKRAAAEREKRPFADMNDLISRVGEISSEKVEKLTPVLVFGGIEGPSRKQMAPRLEIGRRDDPGIRSSFSSPPFDDTFRRPNHRDLPPVGKDTAKRFWDMFEGKSGGLTEVKTTEGSWPDFAHDKEGCDYYSTLYHVYVMDREHRCEHYVTTYIIKIRTTAGAGAGLSAGGVGGSFSAPNRVYDVWEYRIGIRYEYELRVAIIDDVYWCPGSQAFYHWYFEWYIGWGLVGTVDPAVCNARIVDSFESVADAQRSRSSYGGGPQYPSLGVADNYVY